MVLLELRASVDQLGLEADDETRTQETHNRIVALLDRLVDGETTKVAIRARRALESATTTRA